MLAPFAAADRLRIDLGRLLDAIGLGPQESPWQAVAEGALVRLRRYQGGGTGRPILIVPAPIKRAYIWDLRPGISVVRLCLEAGFQVYVVEWREAGSASLTDAVTVIGDCLDRARVDTGQVAVMAGHSLGGTLAALVAARWPELVAGLVLLEAPLCFGEDGGRLVRAARAGFFAPLEDEVPGTLLDWMAVAAAPDVFVLERDLDWLRSLGDDEAMLRHLLVTRWTLDEFPLPSPLFNEVVGMLYRNDLFRRGLLPVAGRPVGPGDATMPVLAVADPDSPLVPPGAVLPFMGQAGVRKRTTWWYRPETGSALRHVGVLVDKAALAGLWPGILAWVERCPR